MRAPSKRTLHRRLAAGVIVVILVAATAWYTRPVDLYALSPDLQAPQDLTCLLLRYTGNLAEDTTRTLDLTAEDGEAYRQVLSQLEALRFRRFPWASFCSPSGTVRAASSPRGTLTPAISWATAPAMCCCNAAWGGGKPSHMTLTAFASGPFPSAGARRPPRRSMNPSGSWPSR